MRRGPGFPQTRLGPGTSAATQPRRLPARSGSTGRYRTTGSGSTHRRAGSVGTWTSRMRRAGCSGLTSLAAASRSWPGAGPSYPPRSSARRPERTRTPRACGRRSGASARRLVSWTPAPAGTGSSSHHPARSPAHVRRPAPPARHRRVLRLAPARTRGHRAHGRTLRGVWLRPTPPCRC